MSWKFWKRKPRDRRVWNEDWQVGDTAECVVGFERWHDRVKPWHRPKVGQRFKVLDMSEEQSGNQLFYFLKLADWPVWLPTQGFRKVRPETKQEESVAERILNSPAGPDRVREPQTTAQDRE